MRFDALFDGKARTNACKVELSGVLSSLTQPIVFENPDPIVEMALLVQAAGLDRSIDKGKLSALALMQERLQKRITALAALHTRREISSRNYVEELDRALRKVAIAGE